MRRFLANEPVCRVVSYITNLDGTIVQHIEYVPFGEVFIEERNNTWNSPYLFNGKELDEETGLYYYGARYYNPRESIFLSVDQMVELTMTPYQYAYQNPVNYTDPTGMIPEGGPGKEGEPEKEQSLPGIVITGQRSTSKVGVKHSVLSSNYNYTAGNRLQSTIKSNSATASIDRTVNEFVSWIPGAESAELGNALEDYQNGDYWGAGFSTFASIPFLGKLTKFGKLGKLFKFGNIFRKTSLKVTAKITTEQSGYLFTHILKEGNIIFKNSMSNTGRFDFVIKEGKVMIGEGHWFMSEGAKILDGAGTLTLRNGKITSISNWSGHYQPTGKQLDRAVEILKDMGYQFSNTFSKVIN